jgi:hypothetical protein
VRDRSGGKKVGSKWCRHLRSIISMAMPDSETEGEECALVHYGWVFLRNSGSIPGDCIGKDLIDRKLYRGFCS